MVPAAAGGGIIRRRGPAVDRAAWQCSSDLRGTAAPRPLKELSGVRGTLLAVLTVELAGAGDPTGGCRGC